MNQFRRSRGGGGAAGGAGGEEGGAALLLRSAQLYRVLNFIFLYLHQWYTGAAAVQREFSVFSLAPELLLRLRNQSD